MDQVLKIRLIRTKIFNALPIEDLICLEQVNQFLRRSIRSHPYSQDLSMNSDSEILGVLVWKDKISPEDFLQSKKSKKKSSKKKAMPKIDPIPPPAAATDEEIVRRGPLITRLVVRLKNYIVKDDYKPKPTDSYEDRFEITSLALTQARWNRFLTILQKLAPGLVRLKLISSQREIVSDYFAKLSSIKNLTFDRLKEFHLTDGVCESHNFDDPQLLKIFPNLRKLLLHGGYIPHLRHLPRSKLLEELHIICCKFFPSVVAAAAAAAAAKDQDEKVYVDLSGLKILRFSSADIFHAPFLLPHPLYPQSLLPEVVSNVSEYQPAGTDWVKLFQENPPLNLQSLIMGTNFGLCLPWCYEILKAAARASAAGLLPAWTQLSIKLYRIKPTVQALFNDPFIGFRSLNPESADDENQVKDWILPSIRKLTLLSNDLQVVAAVLERTPAIEELIVDTVSDKDERVKFFYDQNKKPRIALGQNLSALRSITLRGPLRESWKRSLLASLPADVELDDESTVDPEPSEEELQQALEAEWEDVDEEEDE